MNGKSSSTAVLLLAAWLILALAACGGGGDGGGNGGGANTAPVADTTAPTVAGVTPVTASAIQGGTAVQVRFSERMERSSLVLGGTMAGEAGAPAWSQTTHVDDTVTLAPATAWSEGAGRTLTLDAADMAGNALSAALSLSYDVDDTSPTAGIAPASGSTIAAGTQVAITFDETMAPVSLALGGTMAAASDGGQWTVGDTVLTVSPDPAWSGGAQTLTVSAEDRAGNPVALDLSYTVDTDLPTVSGVTPPNGSTLNPTDPIVITFSKAMDPATLALGGSMTGAGQVASPSTGVAWSLGDTVLTLSPTSEWTVGTGRTLSVDGADTLGNPIAQYNLTYEVNGSPTVAITSHSDGATVTGSRTITLSGTIEDDGSIASVVVNHDGADSSATFDNASFSATLTLNDRGNSIVVTVTDEGDLTASATVTLDFPYATFTTGQAAAVVIGQADFDSVQPNQGMGVEGAAANTLQQPSRNPALAEGKLYVVDSQNHRLLRYDGIPAANDASATLVLGQSAFVTRVAGDLADQLNSPYDVAVGSGKLAVANSGGSNVHIWNSLPATSGLAADVVVGQPDFDLQDFACTQAGMGQPEGVAIAAGRLLVADYGTNRVLIWNTIPTSNGAPADLVLGQDAFDECQPNDSSHDGIADEGELPSASTLYNPTSVWSDGTRLIVADSKNHRVLIWNSFPTVNGQDADVVVGQSGFSTSTSGTTSTTLFQPESAVSNGNQLFVADTANNRVLIWNTIPTSNGEPADVVLGQQDFTTGTIAGGSTGFSTPYGMLPSGSQLLVTDLNHHRVLIYNGQ